MAANQPDNLGTESIDQELDLAPGGDQEKQAPLLQGVASPASYGEAVAAQAAVAESDSAGQNGSIHSHDDAGPEAQDLAGDETAEAVDGALQEAYEEASAEAREEAESLDELAAAASQAAPAPDTVEEIAAVAETALQEAHDQAGQEGAEEASSLDELAAAAPPLPKATAGATAASVGELPVVAVRTDDEPFKEPPRPGVAAAGGPPPLVVQTERGGSFAGGCLRGLVLILLGALLGAALALAILFAANGALNWSSRSEVATLRSDVSAVQQSQGDLGAGMTSLEATLTGVNGRVEVLEQQAGRIDEFGRDIADAQGRVATLEDTAGVMQEEIGAVADNLDAISGQVDQIVQSTERSDLFLTGMQTLLNDIFTEAAAPAAISPTAPLTASEELTVTAPVTATDAITVTEAITGAESITSTEEITGTLPMTDSVTPSATAEIMTTPTPAATPEPTPAASQRGAIQGVVFLDANENGEQEPDELGLAGAQITLRTHDQFDLKTVTTGADGGYRFESLPPGRYILAQKNLAGYGFTTLNIITVILRNDGVATVNFGNYQLNE